MNKFFTIIILNLFVFSAFSQIPNGYYDGTDGLTGNDLRTALHNIIKDHTSKSYDALWNYFDNTDLKSNGKIWDMYSTRADGSFDYEYSYSSDQCGNYSGEGSCYNREHSFPKSWFNDASPMYTDLFHIYPTDGYVNGRRSNYPYGEVGSASWTSTNGSQLGSSDYSGYTGTVFEPIDEYKGDFARTYFYMLTRYQDLIGGWSSPMLAGDDFSVWAKNMLLEWDAQDPVSQKEIDRNNAIYNIQHNRNPFIDHPEWGVAVWDPGSANVNQLDSKRFKVWYSDQAINWDFLPKTEGEIEVYNIVGQKISTIQIVNNQKQQTLVLEKGVYIADFKLDYRRVVKFIVK